MRIYGEDIVIVNALLCKWQKSLGELEKSTLKLEQSVKYDVLLNHIFKNVHSIKNESSFLGLFNITNIGYELEITFEELKSNKISVTSKLIDALLSIIDYFNELINDLDTKLKQDYSIDVKNNGFISYEFTKNEQPILENLKLAREKNETKENPKKDSLQDVAELEFLQTEEFKQGLSEGLKEQFLLESSENIETIENNILIRLDNNSDDREAVNEIFRAVHTIKGSIGIYLSTAVPQTPAYGSLKKFSDLVHTFESMLSFVRDKGYKFEKDLVDLSLTVTDRIKIYLNSIEEDKYDNVTTDDISDRLKQQIAYFKNLPSDAVPIEITSARKEMINKTEQVKLKGSIVQSIRVNQKKIDKIMNVISELIIAKNSFMHISSKLDMEYNLPEVSKEIKQVGSNVNRISDELQNAIISIRMVEVKTVFQKMPRVVRDIAQSTGKKMQLLMEGDSTEIDKTIIEQISDPLVHLIRNAADHGIESPEKRKLQGKPEIGKIVLRAYNKNKYVYIEIEDDGKGMDAGEIKNKAIEKGFITESEAQKMSCSQWLNLIFLPGFSTAKTITEVSGRGVGMDIVKSNISKINGNITIESEKGKGTKMIIQLPLTLAISRGLIVEASGNNYIFPLEYIIETLKLKRSDIHEFEGSYFTYSRGEIIGVEWLSRVFLLGDIDHDAQELNAVIIKNGSEKHAVIVDKLKSEQEFVVKTLDGQLASIPGISGSTLLGDGKVVLIINPPDLLKLRYEKLD